MKKRNIKTDTTKDLQFHEDERGIIADIFYDHPIDHSSYITAKKGSIRGNHYHKLSTQNVFLIRGALDYWYKPVSSEGPAEMVKIVPGDIVESSPLEIHALSFSEDSEFIAFSEGVRGGRDYEIDTFRVPSIVPSNEHY